MAYPKNIQEAYLERSLDLLTEVWNDDSTTAIDINDQLESLVDMVEGKISFDRFLGDCNLAGRERLN